VDNRKQFVGCFILFFKANQICSRLVLFHLISENKLMFLNAFRILFKTIRINFMKSVYLQETT